jgi:hypothetical protein
MPLLPSDLIDMRERRASQTVLNLNRPRQGVFGQAQFPYAPPAAFTGLGASHGDSVRPTSLEVGRRPAPSISITNTQGGTSQKLGPKRHPESSVRF